jgi:uridine kinase
MQIIFIGGASGSGKSSLASELFKQIQAQGLSVDIIRMDDYSCECPEGILDMAAYRRDTNFDCIEMYDFPLLKQHLSELLLGKDIDRPVFDFSTNKRMSSICQAPSDLLIIEGLFALNFAKTHAASYDKICVYIGPSSYLSLVKTRGERDMRERGFTLLESFSRERRFVGPAFFNVIAKAKHAVDVDIINDPESDHDFHHIRQGAEEILQALGFSRDFLFK